MPVQSHLWRSSRYLPSAFFVDRHPIAISPLSRHFWTPSAAPGATRKVKALAPGTGATRAGRLRATLPKAPATLAVNRQTVSEQHSDERATQRDIITRVSGDSQSRSPRRDAEPSNSTWAVDWSWLSHRNPKDTSAGPRTPPAHSNSSWTQSTAAQEKGKEQRAAELPMRKKPTAGALWSYSKETVNHSTSFTKWFDNITILTSHITI